MKRTGDLYFVDLAVLSFLAVKSRIELGMPSEFEMLLKEILIYDETDRPLVSITSRSKKESWISTSELGPGTISKHRFICVTQLKVFHCPPYYADPS